MKWYYKLFLGLLIVLCVRLEVWLYKNSEEDKRMERMIPAAALFVAIASSIIALSNSDRKPKKIKAEVKTYAITKEHTEIYSLKDLPEAIQNVYKHSSETITSYRINFKITNKSGFTLAKPTLTFRLPIDNQHPEQFGEIWRVTYRSNLYNNPKDIIILQFGETIILSNSNAPYWNDKEDAEFWIRMCVDNKSLQSLKITLSINSTNAEGKLYEFTLIPKELLSGTEYIKT